MLGRRRVPVPEGWMDLCACEVIVFVSSALFKVCLLVPGKGIKICGEFVFRAGDVVD